MTQDLPARLLEISLQNLHDAYLRDDINAVANLLEGGVDPSLPNQLGDSLVEVAARDDNKTVLFLIYKLGILLVLKRWLFKKEWMKLII